jgi:surface antigen
MTGLTKVRGAWAVLALALIMTTAFGTLSAGPASGAGNATMLCNGYAGCSQGAYTTHDYQSHEGTSYWSMYPGDNCTNYVAFVESTVYGVSTPTFDLGNGYTWASAAANNGVLVNHTPTVGSVAYWSGGNDGIPDGGHVAIVEAVGPNGSSITISQQHMLDASNGYDWTTIYAAPTAYQWEQWPDSFIHFATAPRAVADLAFALTTNVLLRVVPQRFAHDNFIFSNSLRRVVRSGLVTHLKAGATWGKYAISFQNSALRRTYVLHVSVRGSNGQILRRGGPSINDDPLVRITGLGVLGRPAIVTVVVRRATRRTISAPVDETATSSTTTTLPY